MGANQSLSESILHSSESQFDRFESVVFNNDGSWLAFVSRRGITEYGSFIELFRRDVNEVDFLHSHSLPIPTGTPCKIAFSPDGTHLACGNVDGTISIWLYQESRLEITIRQDFGMVNSVAFNHDGSLLACGGSDGGVELWETRPYRRRIQHNTWMYPPGNTTPQDESDVGSVAFNPQGTMFASGSSDGTIKLWHVDDGYTKIFRSFGAIESVAFNHNGSLLACGSEECIALWETNNPDYDDRLETRRNAPSSHGGSLVWTIREKCGPIAFSRDGSLLAAGLHDCIQIWDPNTREIQRTIKGHKRLVDSVAFNHDATLLASSSYDRSVRLFRLKQQSGDPITKNDPITNLLHHGVFPSEWPSNVPSFGSIYQTYWGLEEKRRNDIDVKIKEQGVVMNLQPFIMWLCKEMAKEDGLLCPVCMFPMSIDGQCGTKQVCMACPNKHLICVECKTQLTSCPLCRALLNESCKLPNMKEFAKSKREADAESDDGAGTKRQRMSQVLNTLIK